MLWVSLLSCTPSTVLSSRILLASSTRHGVSLWAGTTPCRGLSSSPSNWSPPVSPSASGLETITTTTRVSMTACGSPSSSSSSSSLTSLVSVATVKSSSSSARSRSLLSSASSSLASSSTAVVFPLTPGTSPQKSAPPARFPSPETDIIKQRIHWCAILACTPASLQERFQGLLLRLRHRRLRLRRNRARWSCCRRGRQPSQVPPQGHQAGLLACVALLRRLALRPGPDHQVRRPTFVQGIRRQLQILPLRARLPRGQDQGPPLHHERRHHPLRHLRRQLLHLRLHAHAPGPGHARHGAQVVQQGRQARPPLGRHDLRPGLRPRRLHPPLPQWR
ncbi:hypothetical protein VC83_03031 [Pseudogymnoascus destructans]|uniref:Uncharacterized protein n=1 Tax=Pseudogymnoascus destructans TaxID=655981 RepID=A0A177AFF3_9PEZI|nr:uncharacterized protein VC83_03031 [Pseudogymnoascus destructans]OAF60142.1 hypothetical protein VC83_03031 [Pseudogymnoascus destructans]